jgi:hypothetical protein
VLTDDDSTFRSGARLLPRSLQLLLLAAAALVFSLMPTLVSGISLSHLLSSDAEWYVALAARIADPAVLATDRGFAYAGDIKPGVENWLHWLVIGGARVTGVSLGAASVGASVVTLIAFVLLVYWLMVSTLEDDALAFVIALISVIPVHALAATTVGFQPLGFLPRDLALTVAVAVLVGYFTALRRGRGMPLVFLACGLLANVYILVFAHLVMVLWIAEVLREPRRWRRHAGAGLLFAAGAAPVLVGSVMYLNAGTAPDVEIMRMRHPYMMIFPLGDALRTTLRRVLIYTVVTPLLYAAGRRAATPRQRELIAPWARLAIAAFAVTVTGIVIENTTTLWPYHLSRTSAFFILSAMAICGWALAAVGGRVSRPRRILALATVALLLLVQSNLPSIYRHLQGVYGTRAERRDLLDAAEWLRQHTAPDDVVLVPTDVNEDLALTLRVYALRPVYVAFKDGGVSMFDGDKGRDWYARLRRQQAALTAAPEVLGDLMRSEAVPYAMLRDVQADRLAATPGFTVVHRAGQFAIVRVV